MRQLLGGDQAGMSSALCCKLRRERYQKQLLIQDGSRGDKLFNCVAVFPDDGSLGDEHKQLGADVDELRRNFSDWCPASVKSFSFPEHSLFTSSHIPSNSKTDTLSW